MSYFFTIHFFLLMIVLHDVILRILKTLYLDCDVTLFVDVLTWFIRGELISYGVSFVIEQKVHFT